MTVEFDRLRLLWPDHLGLARGKYLTPEKAASGTAHCISLFTLGFDRVMIPHDGGFYWDGLPDCDADFEDGAIRAGWQEGTAVVIPDITREGEPVPLSPRNVLRAAIAKWAAQIAQLRISGKEIVLVSSGAIAEGMQRLGFDKRPTGIPTGRSA